MSNDNSATIVSNVWNYAHILKNAGVDYGDYVEQITCRIVNIDGEVVESLTLLGLPAEGRSPSPLTCRSGV